jgi:hypothetical protein
VRRFRVVRKYSRELSSVADEVGDDGEASDREDRGLEGQGVVNVSWSSCWRVERRSRYAMLSAWVLLLPRLYYDSPEKVEPYDGLLLNLVDFVTILQTLLELFRRILVPLTPGSWN